MKMTIEINSLDDFENALGYMEMKLRGQTVEAKLSHTEDSASLMAIKDVHEILNSSGLMPPVEFGDHKVLSDGIRLRVKKVVATLNDMVAERNELLRVLGLPHNYEGDPQDVLRRLADDLAGCRRAAAETPRAWRLPKRGDRVRVVKLPDFTVVGVPADFKVGMLYEVVFVGSCVPKAITPEQYNADANIYLKETAFGVAVGGEGETKGRFMIPLECFEPAD